MQYSASVFLPGDSDTQRLGTCLAPLLKAGDTLLLDGPIGAGKTSLARAIIQARLAAIGRSEDVPSPTYTLVQTYDDGDTEIWHSDLYRLGDSSEVLELGLEDAFDTAIVLVEWPDRLGDLAPSDALRVRLEPKDEGRLLTCSATVSRWAKLYACFADA